MAKQVPAWKAYEAEILELLRTRAPDAEIVADARLTGRSGTNRQVDVLVSGIFPGLEEPQRMVVECKALARRITIKDVETVAGLIEDVGAPLGLLVTTVGYSAAAKRRAADFRGLSLEV